MSIDKSLVVRSKLRRHRNVLTRTERVDALKKEELWKDERSVFGLPKIRNIKQKPKKPVKAAAAAATAEGAAPAAGADAAKPAADEKKSEKKPGGEKTK